MACAQIILVVEWAYVQRAARSLEPVGIMHLCLTFPYHLMQPIGHCLIFTVHSGDDILFINL
jgi:hypothetical protein